MVDHTIRSMIRFRPIAGEEEAFDELVQAAVAQARDGQGTVDHIWWRGPADGVVTLTEQYLDSNAMLQLLEGDWGRRILPRMLRLAKLESFELFGPISAPLFEAVKGMAPRVGRPLAAYRRSRLDLAIERVERSQLS